MRIDEFSYYLPQELIAQHPVYPRDYARLMVLDRSKHSIEHRLFYEVERYLNKGDVLVLNNSKVIKSRMLGFNEKTHGKREIFLLKQIDEKRWTALTNPNSRVHVGDLIVVNENPRIAVVVVKKSENGENTIEYESDELPFENIVSAFGETPLPPYIKGKLLADKEYQTVYSDFEGSVASPTAGLHFTQTLLEKLEDKGVIVEYITLHVGLGTFKPVKEDDLDKHKMHEEEYFITEKTAYNVNKAKASHGRVFAVGTTAARTLETASTRDGILKPMSGSTRLFIKPGYPFKIVDCLITNFHFPRTTLLALVAAFAQKDFMLEAYDIAVRERYRFYSFGDAMLII
ncbi:MAG: tRNA preQ1(34) S-adenosylmethionine ribosyltransferase-isomerase QueA [Caldisericaceae bacterium]